MTRPPSSAATRVVDGWTTAESEAVFRLLMHAPPRRHGPLSQLSIDARARGTRRYWLAAAAVLAVGCSVLAEHGPTSTEPVAVIGWFIVAIGLFILHAYLRMFLDALATIRTAPRAVGVVQELRPADGRPEMRWADTKTDDGTFVVVTVPTAVAAALEGRPGRFEVMFLRTGRSPTSGVQTGRGFAGRMVVVDETPSPAAEVAPAIPTPKPAQGIQTRRPGGGGRFTP